MRFLNVLICFYFMCFLMIVMEYYYILVVLLFNEWRKVLLFVFIVVYMISNVHTFIYISTINQKTKTKRGLIPSNTRFFKKKTQFN